MWLNLLVPILKTIWQADISFIVVAKACGMVDFFCWLFLLVFKDVLPWKLTFGHLRKSSPLSRNPRRNIESKAPVFFSFKMWISGRLDGLDLKAWRIWLRPCPCMVATGTLDLETGFLGKIPFWSWGNDVPNYCEEKSRKYIVAFFLWRALSIYS